MPVTIPELTSGDFAPVLPAMILALGAILLLLSEVFLSTASRTYQSILTVATAVLAGAVALGNLTEPPREVLRGFGVLDPFSSLLSAVVCLAVGLAALLATGYLRHRNAERGEFYALMLFSTAGMSLLAVSSELITLFINLEVMSVATYAMASYLRRGPRPAEAGFKYFILGAFSTALLVYGAALLYGATGTTKLTEMAGPLTQAFETRPAITYCGLVLIAAGFAFKVAAVPFHMWTPDVYEGAPTPVTALMSAGVKAAAFASLVRVFLVLGTHGDTRLASTLFSVLAFLTMLFGNLLALPQRNVKRMLAYSSIAHAGYLLIGVVVLFAHPEGTHHVTLLGAAGLTAQDTDLRATALRGILFYLFAYTLTVVGAFGLVGALERREDEDKKFTWDLDRFSGLVHRRPAWAVVMAIFMLSLGGIPPTIGFMGKLLLFRAAMDAGLVGLALTGVLTSAAGVYYYLRVVVYMFMRPAADGDTVPERQWSTELALVLTSVGVVALGIVPGSLSGWLSHAGTLWLGR